MAPRWLRRTRKGHVASSGGPPDPDPAPRTAGGSPSVRIIAVGGPADPVKCPRCDSLMTYQEVFGIRRYQCAHRLHHPAVWVRVDTGERITDDDLPAAAQ
jgi:hypothetical protein